MALVMSEHASHAPLDMFKVVRMLLVHDLVETDAGDTWLYSTEARKQQAEREAESALELFGILPDDQADELRALWEEFEEQHSAEAKYEIKLFYGITIRMFFAAHNLLSGSV